MNCLYCGKPEEQHSLLLQRCPKGLGRFATLAFRPATFKAAPLREDKTWVDAAARGIAEQAAKGNWLNVVYRAVELADKAAREFLAAGGSRARLTTGVNPKHVAAVQVLVTEFDGEDNQAAKEVYSPAFIDPDLFDDEPCCENEDRDLNGGCRSCGAPCW